MQDIGLFWQLTIKTIDDLRIVGNENLALEMFVMQLVHLKNIEKKKELIKDDTVENNGNFKSNLIGENIQEENSENNLSTQVKNQLKNINQIKTNPIKNLSSEANNNKIEITSFQDLIDQANKEKEVELRYDLERNVKLVSFNKRKIDISFNEKLNKNFIKTLTEKLLSWTGERWIISLSKNNDAKSIYEQNIDKKSNKLNEFKNTDIAKQIAETFPDAELINIIEDSND
tara:strand:- start:306 stop:995 length:690 start_codon:yes stop_codon:yes gene_type:complete